MLGCFVFSSLRTSFWKSRYDDAGRLGAFGSLTFLAFFFPSASSPRDLRFLPCSSCATGKGGMTGIAYCPFGS